MNSWINWSPDEDGIDYRVKEFFKDASEKALRTYEQQVRECWEREHAKESENAERAELARIQE